MVSREGKPMQREAKTDWSLVLKTDWSLVLFLLVVVAAIVFGVLQPAHAQATMYPGSPYTSCAAVSSTGPCTYFAVTPSISYFTWTNVAGGTVTTATINLEGSIDGTNYFILDQAANTDANWANGEMRHVVNKGINFIRCRVTVLTGGGTLTSKIELVHN